MLNCIIIDDEQHCIDTLTAMLQAKHADKISIAAATTDSRKAAALIEAFKPQVVFMDVEMPHINGIQLMYSFVQRDFAVIFTTAYDKYALQALKTDVVDYLLKPISLTELAGAIEKAEQKLELLHRASANKAGRVLHKLLLPTKYGILAANIPEIIRVESNSNYSTFYLVDKPRITVAKTLKEFEETLTPSDFFRVHQSHLINLHFVEYIQADEDLVILKNGEKIDISRRRKTEFLQRLAAL